MILSEARRARVPVCTRFMAILPGSMHHCSRGEGHSWSFASHALTCGLIHSESFAVARYKKGLRAAAAERRCMHGSGRKGLTAGNHTGTRHGSL
jgi:hypothetical protein